MSLALKIEKNRYRICLVKTTSVMAKGNYTVYVPPAVNEICGRGRVSTESYFQRFRDAKVFANTMLRTLESNSINDGWIQRT